MDSFGAPSCTESLIRCSPGDDNPGTNGFFVSCFVRDTSNTSEVKATRKRRKPTMEDDRQSVRRKQELPKAEQLR